MQDPGEPHRRYGDREIGLILKRAADLQRLEPASAGDGASLTLSDLEEIAAEAGIDPRYLRQAAAEIEATGGAFSAEGLARVLGTPPTVYLERTLAGELSDQELERLVDEIQTASVVQGHTSLLGRTLTWRSSTSQNEPSLLVTVTASHGKTRIVIQERLHRLAGGLYGGIVGGVGGGVGFGVGLGVGLGALGSALFAIAFPAAVVGGSYVLARSVFTSAARSRHRKLNDLLERLTEHVESMGTRGARPELPSG